jgi:predicted aspartyl protease
MTQTMTDVRVLIDTGAFNTMIDLALAQRFGILLPDSMTVSIGGKTGKAQFCVISCLTLNSCVLTRIFALAYPFDDWLMGHILLGTNVMNNWDFTISRSRNVLEFSENIPFDAPNKMYPYQNYFKEGEYVAIQDEL